MFPFMDLMMMILSSMVGVFINPLFWVVILLVYNQYKKSCMLEKRMLGTQKYSVWDRLGNSALVGLAGGLIGSLAMVVVGVTLDNSGILYVWVIVLLLMMINPRYMCFSYAGGIVSLSSLAFGFPHIDVPSLMAIVAILHLVESVLIYLNGHRHSIPVLMEHKGYGVVGGFNLVRLWPIPIIIMTVISAQTLPAESIPMPDWWPLLKAAGLSGEPDNIIYMMMPVVAALGYSDIAITETPEDKSHRSAVKLFGYSLVLLAISVLSSHHRPLQWMAALFGPAFHELLIVTGRRMEKTGVPLYRPSDKGIRILDVLPGSAADKMGIRRGDIIYRINGTDIQGEENLADILAYHPNYLWIDAVTLKGETRTYEHQQYPVGVGRLGVLVVPREGDAAVTAVELLSPVKRLLDKAKGKIRRR